MTALLSLKNISKSFDGISILKNMSLDVYKGDLVLLTGENGVGKTTIFNLITRMDKADAGELTFNEKSIKGLTPLEIANRGVIRLHQHPRVFKNLTVTENLICSSNSKKNDGFFKQFFHYKQIINQQLDNVQKANKILNKFNLEHLASNLAGSLSYGQQKLVAFSMIGMTNAELILLDEPFAGLNPLMIDEVVEIIKHLNDEGRTFLIIEHNIEQAITICNKHIVLENGIVTPQNLSLPC